MDTSSKYDFPWELIAESLTESLTAEDELQLQQWFSSDPENEKIYLRIRDLWKNGMEDYKYYKMANEIEAWKALRSKIGNDHPKEIEKEIILGPFVRKSGMLRNVLAIAAVFVVVAGIGLWYLLAGNNAVVYETAINEQKKVTLADGSVISLQQQTSIKIPRDYNKLQREIIMTSGDAYFEVAHIADKPFTVELGATRINDIGTSFTVHIERNKINLAVASGKVAFVKIDTKETRELTAGSGITFDVQQNSFGDIEMIKASDAAVQLLNFENTSLSEVVVDVQKALGGKVIIDESIASKKFTGQLYGMSYNSVMKVICKSLGLEYTVNDSIYTLKTIRTEQP